MKKVNIYFARHGETIFNRKDYIQGQSDAPLTINGLNGAINLGKQLSDIKFDLAVSSDLRRAADTRDIILEHNKNESIPKVLDPSFREMGFGEYEGDDGSVFWDNMSKTYNVDFHELGKTDFIGRFHYLYDEERNPTAEKLEDFKNRIVDGITKIADEAYEKDQEHVLIVGHGIVTHALLQLIVDTNGFKGMIHNSSVTKFKYDGDKFHLEYIGKTSGDF